MTESASPAAIPSPNIWNDPEIYEVENAAVDREWRIEAAMGELLETSGRWIRQALTGGEMAQLTALLKRLVEAPERGGQPL